MMLWLPASPAACMTLVLLYFFHLLLPVVWLLQEDALLVAQSTLGSTLTPICITFQGWPFPLNRVGRG